MAGTADDIIAYAHAGGGCGCSFNFEPSQIDRPGSPGLHGQHRAVDFGTAECGGPGVRCIYNLFLPLAMGPGFTIEELFAHDGSGYLASWSHGAPSSFRDAPNHCHVGIAAGASLTGVGARTVSDVGIPNPLDLLDSGLKAAVGIILDALAQVPKAILAALFGDSSPMQFAIRVIEVLVGAILMASGAVMVYKLVSKGQAGKALRAPKRVAKKAAKQAQRGTREVRRRVESPTSGGGERVTRRISPSGGAASSAGARASETVTGSKAGGAKLRRMVARAV